MAFNYNKLRGKIVEIYGSQIEFAKAMKWSEKTLSLKLNGKVPWKQTEIMTAVQILGLSDSDIQDYFSAVDVHNI